MITGRQLREARKLLGWSVADTAEVVDGTPSITLHQAALIQQAFERAGLRFGHNGAVLMAASVQK